MAKQGKRTIVLDGGTTRSGGAVTAPRTAGLTSQQKQEALDELVLRHGVMFMRWPDALDRLARVGLTPEDASEDRLRLSKVRLAALIQKKHLAGDLEWDDPVVEGIGDSKIHVWYTRCGLYRIARVHDGDEQYHFLLIERIAANAARESIIRGEWGELKTLRAALDAAEAHHAKWIGRRPLHNGDVVTSRAEKGGLNGGRPAPPPPPPKEGKEKAAKARRPPAPAGGLNELAQQVVKVLGKAPMTPLEIKKAAGIDKKVAIHSTLVKLIALGMAAGGDGAYTAAEGA